MENIGCVIHCMMRWSDSYLCRGLPNIFPMSLHPSLLPLPPSPSLPYMYFCTPIVTQSSTKLSGSGGENWMIPPHHGTLCSSWLCSSILDLDTGCVAAARHLQASSGWQVVACQNLDVSQHHYLNHIFTVEIEICSHDASWPWCWQLQPLFLQER